RGPAAAGEDAAFTGFGRAPPAPGGAPKIGAARRSRGGRLPVPPPEAGRRPARTGPYRRGRGNVGAGHARRAALVESGRLPGARLGAGGRLALRGRRGRTGSPGSFWPG